MIYELLEAGKNFCCGMVVFLLVCGFLTYPFGSDNPDDRRTFNSVMYATHQFLLGAGWLFIFQLAYTFWKTK
jgi:hypothetical protein